VTHCSDEDLILHYYQDAECRAGVDVHLERCVECAGKYRELTSAMELVAPPAVPERDDRYGLTVWQRIRTRLPERQAAGWRLSAWGNGVALAAASVLLVVVGFLAGRVSPPGGEGARSPAPASRAAGQGDRSGHSVLLMSVADHLDRSDRVLTDVMNASDGGDISAAQAWAEDLLWTGRLYRQDALAADEQSVAAVLDDLERTLLDIVHSPSLVTSAELDDMRHRVDSAALLFKVRVMRNHLQHERPAPVGGEEPRIPTSRTS